jgi:hypothetical protein
VEATCEPIRRLCADNPFPSLLSLAVVKVASPSSMQYNVLVVGACGAEMEPPSGGFHSVIVSSGVRRAGFW